jgi:hypothetical protein
VSSSSAPPPVRVSTPTGVHFDRYPLGTKFNQHGEPYVYTPLSRERKYFEYDEEHEEYIWIENYTDRTTGPTLEDFDYSATRNQAGGSIAPTRISTPVISSPLVQQSPLPPGAFPVTPVPIRVSTNTMADILNPQGQQPQHGDDEGSVASSQVEVRDGRLAFSWRPDPLRIDRSYASTPTNISSYAWSDLNATERQIPRPKAELPEPFLDDEDDVEDFIARVSVFIRLHGRDYYKTNTDKIDLFCRLCKGPKAKSWASKMMTKHLEERDEGEPRPTIANLIQLHRRFRNMFGMIERERHAIAIIEEIRQGNMTVREYTFEFNKYANLTGYHDKSLQQFYRRGLMAAVRDRINEKLSESGERIDLDRLQDMAIKKDAYYQAKMREKKSWGENTNPFRSTNPFSKYATTIRKQETVETVAPAAPVEVVAPVVSTSRTVPVRQFTRLTDEDRERLRAENRCFYCREPGHIAFRCPNAPSRVEFKPSEGRSVKTNAAGILAQVRAMSEDERKEYAKLLSFSDF